MSLPHPPHGGVSQLTEQILSEEAAREARAAAKDYPRIVVTPADLSTVRRFGDGALPPLRGPMTREVFNRALEEGRILLNGKSYAWGIPIALPVSDAERGALRPGAPAALVTATGELVALLDVEDVYEWDKPRYLAHVYGTERVDHPGARIALDDPRGWLAGGTIHVLPWTVDRADPAQRYVFSPRETRRRLAEWGWDAAVAFQTRNPLHRAHEYAMVAAVERLTRQGLRAGVVLNPLVGETKSDDVPAAARMEAYERLKERRLLGQGDSDPEVWRRAGYEINDVFDLFALDIKMFYAGPREAVMHAIFRQNYGFSHIIIGRKHADAPYDDGTPIWGDFDAQEIFGRLGGELLIEPVKIGFAAYFDELGRVGLIEEHAPKGWKPFTVSGSVLRQQLQNGETPDPRIIRPEISATLIEAYRRRAAAQDRNLTWHAHTVTREERERQAGHRGATLWFTGLSGSGKSTLANEVAAQLHARGARTFVLDGDNIRHGLNRDLGFSPEARRENIRRIAEVAKLFSEAGVINLTAFISPYREDREAARAIQPEPGRFLEIYVKADLEICESRDPKGLYKKARAGQIKEFTGVSAPYEEPVNPELVVDTGKLSVPEAAALILGELERRGILPAALAAPPEPERRFGSHGGARLAPHAELSEVAAAPA